MKVSGLVRLGLDQLDLASLQECRRRAASEPEAAAVLSACKDRDSGRFLHSILLAAGPRFEPAASLDGAVGYLCS